MGRTEADETLLARRGFYNAIKIALLKEIHVF